MDHQSWPSNLFFILSSPRSGSTLLRNKLDLFENVIALPSDTRIISSLYKAKKTNSLSATKERFVEQMKTRFQDKGWDLNIWDELEFDDATPIAEILRRVFLCWAKFRGDHISANTCFIEKSPDNVHYMPFIRKECYMAKFIHLYRDPRAVVAGLNQKSWSSHNAFANAYRWKMEQKILTRSCDHAISYESLVSRPEESLTSLMEFLGTEYQAELQSVLKWDLSEKIPEVDQAGRPMNTKNIQKFHHTLSEIDREKQIIEHICDHQMRALGYEKSGGQRDKRFWHQYIVKGVDFWSSHMFGSSRDGYL